MYCQHAHRLRINRPPGVEDLVSERPRNRKTGQFLDGAAGTQVEIPSDVQGFNLGAALAAGAFSLRFIPEAYDIQTLHIMSQGLFTNTSQSGPYRGAGRPEAALATERIMDVSWAPTTKSIFLVQIQIEALDRSGLLSDVTRVLSEHHVNILSASVSTRSDRVALSRFV